MGFFSVLNGLSCETIKREPKISFHRNFKRGAKDNRPLFSKTIDYCFIVFIFFFKTLEEQTHFRGEELFWGRRPLPSSL